MCGLNVVLGLEEKEEKSIGTKKSFERAEGSLRRMILQNLMPACYFLL